MEKHLKERAIILRTQEVKESDLIVTLLTESHGKISAIAKGARKSKRRFMGGLEVFDCATFELQNPKDKKHLYYLNSISNRESWLGLRNDFQNFSLAAFCIEVTNSFAQEDDPESSHLFSPLLQALRLLNDHKTKTVSYVPCIVFSLHLIKLSGFDILHDTREIAKEMRSWWSTLLQGSIPPVSKELERGSFYFLVDHLQQIIGKRFQTVANL